MQPILPTHGISFTRRTINTYKKYFNHEYNPLTICKYKSQIFTFFKPSPTIPLAGSLNDYIQIFSTRYLRDVKKFTENSWMSGANNLYKNRNKIPFEKLNQQILKID